MARRTREQFPIPRNAPLDPLALPLAALQAGTPSLSFEGWLGACWCPPTPRIQSSPRARTARSGSRLTGRLTARHLLDMLGRDPLPARNGNDPKTN